MMTYKRRPKKYSAKKKEVRMYCPHCGKQLPDGGSDGAHSAPKKKTGNPSQIWAFFFIGLMVLMILASGVK